MTKKYQKFENEQRNNVSKFVLDDDLTEESSTDPSSLNHVGEGVQAIETESAPSSTSKQQPVGSRERTSVQFDVLFVNSAGEATIRQNDVSARPGGETVINTAQYQSSSFSYANERPLKKSTMRLTKAFSVVALVLFFPTGLMALFYALKMENEFERGILRGNIDKARKYAKKTERLIIFSFLFAFIVSATCIAIVERLSRSDEEIRKRTYPRYIWG